MTEEEKLSAVVSNVMLLRYRTSSLALSLHYCLSFHRISFGSSLFLVSLWCIMSSRCLLPFYSNMGALHCIC